MPIGPGRYDDLATLVRENSKAKGVIVLILGGSAGSGFSCQADLELTLRIPKMLRDMADQIEAGINEGNL